MKTTTTLLKTGLVGLFLTLTTGLFGQSQTPPGPIDPLGPQSPGTLGDQARGTLFSPQITSFDDELINSILFYNPDVENGFTLRASAIEDHADDRGLAFTHYTWEYGTNGTAYSPVGTDSPTLAQTGAAPGYHYYRVSARIIPEGTDPDLACDPDNVEVFVVFVLPPLNVTVANIGDFLQYCESDAADQTNVQLAVSEIAYDGYTETPVVDDFAFNYRWYAVKSEGADPFSRDNADFLEIDETKADITDATEVGTDASYTPQISAIGTYKFFVEVEYVIKDRSTGLGTDDPEDRNRPHVIYRSWVGGTDQASASIVTVTPQPGKPHITIEEVID
jgi:hypothetical protein